MLNFNSAEEAVRPLLKRMGEQGEDWPKVWRATLDNLGEKEFWRVVPPAVRPRVMHYLEKTGWQRPSPARPAKSDFDKAIDFFRTGAWSRLSDAEKAIISERYA